MPPSTQEPNSEDVIFYTNPMSRGRIVRWMLEETGCPYRAEIVAHGAEMRRPEYLAVNPMGKVPAIRHRGQVVTECAAICAYLADAFPEAGLAPLDAERGGYYRWMFFAAGPLEQAATNKVMGFEPEGERQQGMAGYGSYARTLDALERMLPAEGYLTGPRFTAADVYVGAHFGWGLQFGSLEPRPGFREYWDRLKDRPARVRAEQLDDALMPQNGGAG